MANEKGDLQELAKNLKGVVILPNNPEYDTFRKVFSGEIDRKPRAIIRVANVADIQKTIGFAQEHDIELTIRSGGHSAQGFGVLDDGIVLDLREMRNITIDATEKAAWVETGLTAGEVTNELDTSNFVVGFGDTGSVGVGGITLGGGVGFLVRKFGLTIDNLVAAKIVTADGQILEVDEEHYSDLFWAIRGGGGNFGVVTACKYKLHELQECYGGLLFLPATPETIVGCIDIASAAPDELSTIFNIMPIPPMPFVPAEHHGKLSIMAMIMFAGDPKEGERILAPLKALATPMADMLKPMRYKDIFFPEDDSYHPKAVARNLHMKTIDYALAEKILTHLNSLDAEMKALQLRVLGGAMARVSADSTAYAHRQSAIMANVATFYTTEEEKEARRKWVDDFLTLLDQGDDAVYVGFLGLHDTKDRIKDVYPDATWQRLVEVKKKYDPTNFFHNNVNISI